MSSKPTFKDLHQPSNPLIIPNVWDRSSLRAVLSLNTPESTPVRAVATASWAVADTLGIKDEELSLEQNLSRLAELAPIAREAGIPISVDLQDGYGDRIREAVASAAAAGAEGANIEDSRPEAGYKGGVDAALYPLSEQVERLRTALEVAPAGFAVNARCDVFRLEPAAANGDEEAMAEAVRRGKAYLDAGATTVFYWGGGRGLRTGEVERLVAELGGRVAVKTAASEGALTARELGGLGVARVSVGPGLYLVAMKAVREAAERLLSGGKLEG
ncbi:related to carboxyphosphonoenolpyruvate phosphonomutase-like protein [Cephalotrichum gorgonifer]|uniref:Related to carboxyphosphonoenolpyruvate phosphonomutase-like protein n=1 Tax=Cephalotrichum gorgonifer TaxID=2041049 RepID=A0AAE8SU64_9PEZI|nr:related to carboxyphosphonoenolpyruvate phosphonomutase-like protein [Cephalotrichum gorgonifer]